MGQNNSRVSDVQTIPFTSHATALEILIMAKGSRASVISQFEVVSDKAASLLIRTTGEVATKTKVILAANSSDATANAQAQDKLAVASTSGYANGDNIFVQAPNELFLTYYALHASTAIVSATILQLAAVLPSPIFTGVTLMPTNAQVWREVGLAQMAVGASTVVKNPLSQKSGLGYFVSNRGAPMRLALDGTAQADINSGQFYYTSD